MFPFCAPDRRPASARPSSVDARPSGVPRSTTGRSLWELGITLIPWTVRRDYRSRRGRGLPFARAYSARRTVPTAPFIIQHDCGHDPFCERRSNGLVWRRWRLHVVTPYDCWSLSHARHHAMTGNLDKRGFGDVDTLTVRETEIEDPAARICPRPPTLTLFASSAPPTSFAAAPSAVGLMQSRAGA